MAYSLVTRCLSTTAVLPYARSLSCSIWRWRLAVHVMAWQHVWHQGHKIWLRYATCMKSE